MPRRVVGMTNRGALGRDSSTLQCSPVKYAPPKRSQDSQLCLSARSLLPDDQAASPKVGMEKTISGGLQQAAAEQGGMLWKSAFREKHQGVPLRDCSGCSGRPPTSSPTPAQKAVANVGPVGSRDASRELQCFFQGRSLKSLLGFFREHSCQAGRMDYDSFSVAMRKLNGNVSETAMREVFRAADADSSGHIDIREFVDRFRALPHERDTFFWGERTKQHLLSRNDRLELAQRMGELHRPHRSTDELLQLVRAKTAKMGAKDYFRAVDTGRVNKIGPADFQEALRSFATPVTSTEAAELIAAINTAAGEPALQTHCSYHAFARVFSDAQQATEQRGAVSRRSLDTPQAHCVALSPPRTACAYAQLSDTASVLLSPRRRLAPPTHALVSPRTSGAGAHAAGRAAHSRLSAQTEPEPLFCWQAAAGSGQDAVAPFDRTLPRSDEVSARLRARVAASSARREAREAAQQEKQRQLESKLRSLNESRSKAKAVHIRAEADRTLVTDSRNTFDVGRRIVLLDKPMSEHWPPAVPHMSSHWGTIFGANADPVRTKPQPLVARNRSPVAALDTEELAMPTKPVWGGCSA